MKTTLAFDVYGTLIDTQGVRTRLREIVGDKADAVSAAWRAKQLEYSFRRGLMRSYVPLPRCTSEALDFVCTAHSVSLTDAERESLLDGYTRLPAFDDAADGLAALRAAGFRLYAFSNGTADDVNALLTHARIRDQFLGVVSAEEVETFKPDPRVYQHFLKRADVPAQHAWLISSNAFDVLGALSAGMRAAWVQRSAGNVFDPWGTAPSVTVTGLAELAGQLTDYLAQT